ncbi:hypothetical protein MBLNU230_g2046t1 [Neophaeotheca triangularis]
MAKVSSTAPPASRNGDGHGQSAPSASAPGARVTRSASREPVEQTSPRRTRGARQQQVLEAGVKGGQPQRHVENGNSDNVHDQQLATVVEDDHAIDPELTAADDAEALRRASVGAQSVALSGTTAKTSFSDTEIGQIDKDLVLETLPRLDADAESILQLLLPTDLNARAIVWKEIAQEGSLAQKIFARRLASFTVDKSDFGSKLYIDQNIVLRVLLDALTTGELPNGLWRPDPLLAKANVAQALAALVQIGNHQSSNYAKCYEGLLPLERSFAKAIGTPVFTKEAFETYLAIATQLAITRLAVGREESDFSPHRYVTMTFWEDSDDGESVFPHIEDLHMQRLQDDALQACMFRINERAQDLLEPFGEGDMEDEQYVAAVNALHAKYPWSTFLEEIRKYAVGRKAQLDRRIMQAGGTEGLVAKLRKQVDQLDDARLTETRKQSLMQTGGTPTTKKGYGKGAAAYVRERQQQVAQQNVAPIAQMGQAPIAYPQNAPPMDDNLEDFLVDPTPDPAATAQGTAQAGLAQLSGRGSSNLEMLSNFQTQQARNAGQATSGHQGKQRSFLDRQAGAQRIEWETQPSQYSNYNAEDAQLASRLGKHARDEPDEQDAFEPTQDEGFQVDTRDHTGTRVQRALAPAVDPGPAPMASMGSTLSEEIARSNPAKRQRKNPGSSIPQPLAPFEPDDDMSDAKPTSQYERAKISAKQKRAIAQSQKPPQVRRPWNDEEEAALIELIEELGEEGISWSSLKSADSNRGDEPRLPNRSSEDMRFKARNMKLTFLLGEMPLPQNWSHVILDKKARDKLADRGIQYHQESVRQSGVGV